MKIYLAARYSRREELCDYRRKIEAMGHTVTSRWLNGNHQISDTGTPIGENPAKVWKRLGLGIVDGQRQRKTTNADLAVKMGYNPRRRSVMWMVGDNLIRCRNPEYYAYYVSEKERLGQKWPEATKLHVHRAAHRHMEKRFVRDLWREWNGSSVLILEQEAA